MYLEHANITVPSIDKSVDFLSAAFPDFRERGGGALFGDEKLGKWLHFGNDETYVALQEVTHEVGDVDNNYQTAGVNHIGFVVEDIETIVERCKSNGHEPTDASSMGVYPYRNRVYFIDGCGLEWEFVQYLSDDKSEQNDYQL